MVNFTGRGQPRMRAVMEIVMITSGILPPQKCGKLDPTFASATLLFQKDCPANVQLFQVSIGEHASIRGPCRLCQMMLTNGK